LAAAFGFAFLKVQPAESRGIDPTPVQRARGGEVLWIDGNLDGFGVAFKHAEHEKREGAKESCVKCHHMNLPRDENSACARCHTDMYRPVDAFRHAWHASPTGGRVACYQCHTPGQVRTAATAARCDSCHKNLVPAGATIDVKKYRAVAYTEAMHRMCIGCHVKKAKENNKPDMVRCAWCHKERRDVLDSRTLVLRRIAGDNVVLPPVEIGK
jgi:Zn finger protein HypA/HybF involved in hydrogenase expression